MVVEKVVDVPEFALLFPQVSLYSFFKVCLCGADVSVQAFCEVPLAQFADDNVSVFCQLDD